MEVAQNSVTINALRKPSLPQLRLQRNRLVRGFFYRSGAVRFQINAVEIELASRDGEAAPCQGELWIQPHRLSIELGDVFCYVEGLGVIDCDRAQVGVVRCRILRGPLCDGSLFGAGEFGVELVGNGAGDLTFHSEDIVECTIVAFRPKMLVRCGANQLDVHMHSVSDFLHTALEEIRYA